MTSVATNKRIRQLPDRPLVGEEYNNAGSRYRVVRVDEDCGTALVERPKDGWRCLAHGPALYQMEDGSIELQWNYSTGGHF